MQGFIILRMSFQYFGRNYRSDIFRDHYDNCLLVLLVFPMPSLQGVRLRRERNKRTIRKAIRIGHLLLKFTDIY